VVIMGIVIATTLICILMGALYKHLIVRYAIAIFAITVGLINSNKIKRALKEIFSKEVTT